MRLQQQEPMFGRFPNVHFRAPTMEELRQQPTFEALPPAAAVALAGTASARYVRQDDALWGELHAGVLTTGLVRSALGLYEKGAVKKVGIPSSRAGHGELLSAYRHLQQAAGSIAGGSGGSMAAGPAVDAAAEAAAAAHNAAAVVAYNAAKLGAAAEPATPAAPPPQDVAQASVAPAGSAAAAAAGAAAGKSKHARRRQRKKQEQAATAAVAAGGAAAGAAAGSPAAQGTGGGWGVSEEAKLRKARTLGSLGLLSICCSWGSAQEAASLVQVAAAFPGSQLAEVGLCRLQEALLPPAWGFAPGSLPPIGASPDALIRHRLPPAGNGSAPAGAAATGAGGEPGAAAVAGGGAAGGAAAAAANGSVAAAAPPALGPWNVDALLGRLQLTSPDSVGSSSSSSSRDGVGSSSSSGGGGGGAGGGGSSYLVEVVEVKNTCPFGHSRRGGKLRTSQFAVADRGPRMVVPPEWVPQLQLHMLCADTPSGLLISRSATKGARIFRMRRDDELLRCMLQVISRLWVEHVLAGRPPPPDAFANWHVHHDMLRRIGESARGAELVAVLEEGQHLPPGDPRFFLD